MMFQYQLRNLNPITNRLTINRKPVNIVIKLKTLISANENGNECVNIILYAYVCTLQIHQHLLTMASKPSKTTPTSTIVRPDQISQPPNIPTAQQNSDAKPTKPIPKPKPSPTSVAQHHVTDAARLTSSSPTSRRMFFDEVARRCFEVANQEKDAEKPVPEPRRRPTTLPIKPQNALPTHNNQGGTLKYL